MPEWESISPQRMQLFIELFTHIGYRSPSMLDIASHLGISKKTLYTYVPNKEQLILLCLKEQTEAYDRAHQIILEKKLSSKAELWELFGLVWQFYQEFSQHAVQDLAQYYQQAFRTFKNLEEQLCQTVVLHFSVNQTYNKDFSPTFCARLICNQIKDIVYKEFSVDGISQSDLLHQIFIYNWEALSK